MVSYFKKINRNQNILKKKKIWEPFKGQIKPKADWRSVDSPKKRTKELVLLCFSLFTTKNKQICLFVFWVNLRHANLLKLLFDLSAFAPKKSADIVN